jgi:hypothetical protein
MARTALLVLGACATACNAFMDDLPLEVLSVTPVASDGSDDAQQVSGKDALTVTFSRAVIALGSDFGPGQLPADLVPFTISADVPGRLRWVTTFTARFDPTDQWPTDLSFELRLNPALTSFDGVALSNDSHGHDAHSFTTTPVVTWMNSLKSAMAAAATDNTWVPDVQDGALNGAKEMPPDGVLTIGFSHEIDASLLAGSLQLLDGDGAALPRGGPTLEVVPCAHTWEAEKCISARLSGDLALDTKYTVSLPEGTHYHPLCGATQSAQTFMISGLVSFKIPFKQGMEIPDNQYQRMTPSFRRWDLWVRHGLAASTSVKDLKAAISIEPALPFTLTQLSKATLRMEGDFEPGVTYTIAVAEQPDVLDGFNLPLVATGSMFQTADKPTFFVEAGDWSHKDAIYSATVGGGFPEQWTALSQGADQCLVSYRDRDAGCEGHDAKFIDGFSVQADAASITGAIASLYSDENFPAHDAVTAKAESPVTDALSEVSMPTSELLSGTGLFVHSRWDSMSYDKSLSKTSALGGLTDIGATFVQSSKTELTAWVTSLSDNTDVAGVVVDVYQVSQTYRCTPDKVSLLTSGTTDANGMADLDTSALENSYTTLVAVLNNNGKLMIVRDMPRFNNYDNGGSPDAALVTDRGLYKAGDTVHLKGFVRDHSGTDMEIPTGAYTVQVHHNPYLSL